MRTEVPSRIREAALAALVERDDIPSPNLVVVAERQDVIPSTGRPIFLLVAAPADQPNALPIGSIVVDDEGAPIDIMALRRREATEFFAPTVAASVTESSPAR